MENEKTHDNNRNVTRCKCAGDLLLFRSLPSPNNKYISSVQYNKYTY